MLRALSYLTSETRKVRRRQMANDNGNSNTKAPLKSSYVKDSYQPVDLLQRGYLPKLQLTGTPVPPHVGSAAVIPSAKAPTNGAPPAKQK
jgi:hypothetical protein